MSNESGDEHREPLEDEEKSVDKASLEAVVESGKRRRVRLLAGAGVLLAALAGGAVLVANLVSDNGPGLITTSTVHEDSFDGVAPPTTGPATLSVAPTTTLPPIFDSISEIPPAGTMAFDWHRSTLPVPPGMEAWVDWVAATDDGFIAVGMGFDITGELEEGPTGDTVPPTTIPGDADFGPRLLVWESKDGLTWDLVEGVEGFPRNIGELFEVVVTDAGFTAIGMVFEDQPPFRDTPVVLTSPDGRTWTSTELTADLQEHEHMYLHQSVAGAAGSLAVGSIDFFPPEPPIVIQKDGKTLTIDHNEFTLIITDDATGAILYEGTPEDVHGQGGETEEGLAVYHPETRDLLFVIPWEELDRELESGTGTFERDGYRLILSDRENTYRVEDAATGEELFSGSTDDLFMGPPPRFVDAEGNIILEFTWEEYFRAEEEAYESFEEDFEDQYYSRPVAFFSADGTQWSQVELGLLAGNQNAWIDGLASGPNGFLLTGNVDNRDTGQVLPVVWSSTNGVDWQTMPAGEVGRYLHSLLATDTGYLALGPGGEDRSAVYSSTDGVEWDAVLSVGGPEGTGTGFYNMARGGLGVFVTGERFTAFAGSGVDDEPVATTAVATTVAAATTTTVSHPSDEEFGGTTTPPSGEPGADDLACDERVFIHADPAFDFAGYETPLEAIDHSEAAGLGTPVLDTEDGDHSSWIIYDEQGTPVARVEVDRLQAGGFWVFNHELCSPPYQGFDDHEEEFAPPEVLFYYSPDGVTFYEVAADELLTSIFISQVAIGDDRVVLIVDEFTFEEFGQGEEFFPRAPVVLVGTPAA